MNYEHLWKILEDLFVELTNKEVTVPRELLNDLKTAKTLISIYATDWTALEIATQIEMYLDNVESNLIYLAESNLGNRATNIFMKKISEARQKGLEEKVAAPIKFVSGVQRGEYWIRIDISNLINEKELNSLLKKLSLSSKTQEDGHILVHGKEENVKVFVKELSVKLKEKKS